MGRSRGGLTSKIHALVDAEGRPIRLKLSAGQAHDGPVAPDMLASIGAGVTLIADRAYDANWLREAGNVRALSSRRQSLPFSDRLYRQRNAIERFFNTLKHFPAVATPDDKRDDNFLASVQLASIRIRLRTYESVT